MKKNLFLLFFCIVMVLLLKQAQVKEVMERREIQHMEVLNFTGKLFLPRTLPYDEELVNKKFVVITLAGTSYTYAKDDTGRFRLEEKEADEVPVMIGDSIVVSHPVRLFFARRMLVN